MRFTSVVLHLQGGIGNQLFQLAKVLDAGVGLGSDIRLCLHRAGSTPPIDKLVDLNSIGEILGVRIHISRKYRSICAVDSLLLGLSSKLPSIAEMLKRVGFPSNFGYDLDLKIRQGVMNFFWGFFQDAFPSARTLAGLRRSLLCATELVAGEAAAHFRGGDFLGTGFGILCEDYYRRALSQFCKDLDVVYVGQNTQASVELLATTQDLQARHPADSDELEDFARLIRAEVLILSNSSFAWWAAVLRDEGGVVVAPSRWSALSTALNFPRSVNWKSVDSCFYDEN